MDYKLGFYQSLKENERQPIRIALEKFKPSEERLGKDLLFFNTEELIAANRTFPAVAQYQSKINGYINKYFNYGVNAGYIEENIAKSRSIKSELYAKDESNLFIKSPMELSRKFLEWFPTIHLGTVENQHATMLWLLFEGFDLDDIFSMRADAIQGRVLCHNGEEHLIPACILPFILKTRDESIFNIYSRDGMVVSPLRRVDNGKLIRSRNQFTRNTLTLYANRLIKTCNTFGYSISMNSLAISGSCWETRNIEKETGILSYNIFARRQHWENIKSERAVEKMVLYAKYDYANYIRTFYPDESK